METTLERDAAYAKQMMAKADKILADVDDAYIIQERGHSARQIPGFRHEEISLGALLGIGGFGIVHEIRKFTLDDDDNNDNDNDNDKNNEQQQLVDGTQNNTNSNNSSSDPIQNTCDPKKEANQNSTDPIQNGSSDMKETSNNPRESSGETASVTVTTDNPSTPASLPATDNNKSNNIGKNGTKSRHRSLSYNTIRMIDHPDEAVNNDHVHYDILQARHLMEKRCMRRGVARYALKRLHNDLTELERARGMIDLAVEAKILSVVWHPNIIKLRGIAKGSLLDPGFYIIVDRLHETLDKRIRRWWELERKYKGCLFGIGSNRRGLKSLLLERLTVIYDLAAAFFYLHENRLVYRDIKPENIGFDLRGDVKVFDFGLCKSLSNKLKALEGYGYRLTGRAGSLPYMAPEVVRMESYDTKCDVFSFAILLWEILSLRQAFKGYTPSEFVDLVVVKHERLPINLKWPALTRLIIPEAWDKNPQNRPDMKRVAIVVRADLNDMTTDDRVLHRTNHMDDRSHHSMEMEEDESDGHEKAD